MITIVIFHNAALHLYFVVRDEVWHWRVTSCECRETSRRPTAGRLIQIKVFFTRTQCRSPAFSQRAGKRVRHELESYPTLDLRQGSSTTYLGQTGTNPRIRDDYRRYAAPPMQTTESNLPDCILRVRELPSTRGAIPLRSPRLNALVYRR